VASQRMLAGLTEVGRAADAAAKAQAAAAAAGPSRLVAGMSAAGDVNAVASQRMLAGMSAGGEQAAKGIGLARHELINLSRQAQDVAVSLASGQSPLMVLMQQGSQIADVFIASGKSVGSFCSQAIDWAKTFFMSTAGIVTGIAAFGVAAVYAMSQFVTASKTVEQALEEQNRLLKEGKALIDAKTSAEAKAAAQMKGQTQFETQRNLLDLQLKLNKAMEDAARIAERLATTPTGGGMPEMGIAPSGVQALKDPGYAEIKTAVDNLNASIASGQPGLKQFNDELGKVGIAHPELGNTIEKLMVAGAELENATLKAKAMSDALKGIATDAQLAAVGLGSVAQFQLNNRMAGESAAATERQAQATLKMAQAYPGMSIEVAKTLEGLKGQLGVAEAVGVTEQLSAQRRATINQLLLEGKTLQEATAIANAQQAIAEAQIVSAHLLRMEGLRDQLNIAQQITGIGQINAQHEANINELLRQGLPLHYAIAEADLKREIALAQVNAEADKQLKNLQQQGELIRASSDFERERIRAAHEYTNLVERGVEAEKAGAIAAQMTANAREQMLRQEEDERARAEQREADKQARSAEERQRAQEGQRNVTDEAENYGSVLGRNNTLLVNHRQALDGVEYAWLQISEYIDSYRFSLSGIVNDTKNAFNPQGYESTYDPLGLRYNVANIFHPEIKKGNMSERFKEYSDALNANTDATKENTQTMTDVLSPFYSSDPRRTHLGFRSFAGGGIMTPYGELPLKHYQGGGVATSPQVAVYGEGSTPEAYVPVPAGRIPVEIRQPANSNQRPVNVTINVMGNADANTVAALKSTAFQQAQTMRRAMG